MDARHYINGQDLGSPNNWQDIEITVDWLNRQESGAINVSDLTFNLEANNYLQKRILNGLSGGVGIFEGEPYRIEFGDPQNPRYTFDGYLDFTENLTSLGSEEITCSLKRRKGEDWLNDVANGFSFASLYDEGVITDDDFVKVPYVINYIPDGMQLIVLSMSIFMMTKELIENTKALSESIAEIIKAATPIPGVSFSLTPGVTLSWDLGAVVLASAKAIIRIVYIVAITIAIIKLIESLFDNLIQVKRHHLGMTFRSLFEKACEKLGLEFRSSIKELEWVHIPRKDRKGGEKGETGFPTNSGAMYLFGDLIGVMKRTFNADFRVVDGVFQFERLDKFQLPSSYRMPETFNNQERLLQQFELNTDEMISNYNIFWNYDVQDENTLDNQQGRVFQAITKPVSSNNKDLTTIKNLAQINIPFSIGKDKQDLNTIEQVFKSLASIVDGLTGVFGNGTNFKSKVENRIGSLLLSSHFLTYGKVVVMNGDKLARNQRELLDARLLWDNFHFINSFAEYQGSHNQFFIYREQPVPMTLDDFFILLKNNISEDADGNELRIDRVVYNNMYGSAIIDYRIKKKYTNNLTVKFS